MIVPMKKVSLITLGDRKRDTLKKLRKLGIFQIEATEGNGERLSQLNGQLTLLENAAFLIGKKKNSEHCALNTEQALSAAEEIVSLTEKKKKFTEEIGKIGSELERLEAWGEIDPNDINELEAKGIKLSFYEMPRSEYEALDGDIKAVRFGETKSAVRLMLTELCSDKTEKIGKPPDIYRLSMPEISTGEMKRRLSELKYRIDETNSRLNDLSSCADGIKSAVTATVKEIEFEIYATGMSEESISDKIGHTDSVAFFKGYVEAAKLDSLKQAAANNSWGLFIEDPNEEDNVPTKLENNRFVSLIYPLTDFLGTVPGYFEYDISGWFLAFILIFFGIIFGDGGYGLLICAAAAVPIIKALISRKKLSPMFLLVGLFGLSTVLWGTLTCTWFGLSPEQLPNFLKKLSVPVISNVYSDRLWHPFWTNGVYGLTTAQNLQIFCFTLALLQLTAAHMKCAVRNRGSAKILGDIGSALQLLGIYYLVLNLVVNSEVFGFGLVIGGIPIGTSAVALTGIGFTLSFIFSNYEGSLVKSVLSSLKNIVSVLLGVVNVFSDIVSYIRLWAVGLAGAAISATVNELAGPLLGNFMFTVLAVVLLVFGHGLNMILNVLSVIVHGIRLNTLEFSSHLDMSWSGHKFTPFKE